MCGQKGTGIPIMLTKSLTLPKKKYLVGTSLVVMLSIGVYTQSQAALLVHDPAIHAKIIAQIQKAVEQINLVKKQLDLQIFNAKTWKEKEIDPFKSQVSEYIQNYKELEKSVNSFLTSAKDAPKELDALYKDATSFDLTNTSYDDINNAVVEGQRSTDSIVKGGATLVQDLQKQLAIHEKALAHDSELLGKAKGANEIAQVRAKIDLDNSRINAINSQIQALTSKVELAKQKEELQRSQASQAFQEKTANDFKKRSEELLNQPNQYDNENSDHYVQLTRKQGWW